MILWLGRDTVKYSYIRGVQDGRSWHRDSYGHLQTPRKGETGLDISQQHGQEVKGSHARGEMDSLLNKLNTMFLGLESTEKCTKRQTRTSHVCIVN